MDQLPHVKYLERLFVSRLMFNPCEYYEVDGLEPKHFLDQESKEAFRVIYNALSREKTWSIEDFEKFPGLLREPFERLSDIRAASVHILETYERRLAVLKAQVLVKAANTADINELRRLTGSNETTYSLHPWADVRQTVADAYEPRPPRAYAINWSGTDTKLSDALWTSRWIPDFTSAKCSSSDRNRTAVVNPASGCD